MTPIRIFISSVQKEFADERAALRDYLRGDALMRRFFEVFLFEDVPAADGARTTCTWTRSGAATCMSACSGTTTALRTPKVSPRRNESSTWRPRKESIGSSMSRGPTIWPATRRCRPLSAALRRS